MPEPIRLSRRPPRAAPILRTGWVRFRAEHDKKGHEQWVPLTQLARKVVLTHLGSVPAAEWLFPGERRAEQPVGVSVMSRRLGDAYESSKLTAKGSSGGEVTAPVTPPDREERTLRAGNE